jgi:hypothetical protein
VKVAVAERKKKKKTQDVPLSITLEKKTISKRKNPSMSEKDKGIVIENPHPEAPKTQEKKQ